MDSLDSVELRDPQKLYTYITSHIHDQTTTYYVLLDEIQYAITKDEFHLKQEQVKIYEVLNGLLHKRNVDVYVTGSNSRLLSKDVLTQFRGRGDQIDVRPLSFQEFTQGFQGDRYQAWYQYVTYGGMPQIVTMPSLEQKVAYLNALIKETYLKDIIARYDIKKTQELEQFIEVLSSSIGALTSLKKIEDTFKSVLQSKISYNTLQNFAQCLKEAFVIDEAQRYDIKGRRLIGATRKYYFEDLGIRNVILGFRQVEETHIMENIIYNELRTRGYNVDVGVVEQQNALGIRKSLECDFVANLGSERIYIQSAYQMPTAEKIAQEKASLLQIDDSFQKLIIVKDPVIPLNDDKGIKIMSIYDFLLDPASLTKYL